MRREAECRTAFVPLPPIEYSHDYAHFTPHSEESHGLATDRQVDPITKTLAGHDVQLPRSENLVALKLHAAKGPDRSKPEIDWEDIRQIVHLCGLILATLSFEQLSCVLVAKRPFVG